MFLYPGDKSEEPRWLLEAALLSSLDVTTESEVSYVFAWGTRDLVWHAGTWSPAGARLRLCVCVGVVVWVSSSST